MSKSILQTEKECYITHSTKGLHEHHIFGGCYRDKSERYGLKVWLRADWHVGTNYAVHSDKFLMTELRKDGQRAFEKKYGHDLFVKEFCHDYLKGEK